MEQHRLRCARSSLLPICLKCSFLFFSFHRHCYCLHSHPWHSQSGLKRGHGWISRKCIFDWECRHERVENFLWGLLAECACHISCCSSNSLLSHTTSTSVSISRDLFPSLQLWQTLSFALMFWLLVHLAALIGVWALMPVAACQCFSSHILPFCTSSIQQELPPPCLFP